MDHQCKLDSQVSRLLLILIQFDNLPANTLLPDHYGDITWGNEYAYVHNTSTDPLQNFDEPVGPPSPPSRHNYITNSGNNVALLSSTFEERFGLKEVSVLCRFPPFQEGDPNLTNGKPCGKYICVTTQLYLIYRSYHICRKER